MIPLIWRVFLFIPPLGLSAYLAVPPLLDLLRASQRAEYYSHIVFVPLVSAYIFMRRRRRIFSPPSPPCVGGALISAIGLSFYAIVKPAVCADLNDCASAAVFSGLLVAAGAFLLIFGWETFCRARFPILFLLFVAPIPTVLMEKIIHSLVAGSTAVTAILFKSIGVPFFQEGSIFDLPEFSLEVTKECSGIRSSLALFIVSILIGHMALRGFWKKALLAAVVFPITIFKNGVRIVVLYLLSIFVDMRIIDGGFLHRSGGFVFFGIGLAILAVAAWILKKLEANGP